MFTPTPCVMCLFHLSHVTCHLSPFTCNLSHVTCYLLPVTCHLSPVTCHLSPVTCHLSPVTCHLSPVTCSILVEPGVKLIVGGSVINVAYLPRLVFTKNCIYSGHLNFWSPVNICKFSTDGITSLNHHKKIHFPPGITFDSTKFSRGVRTEPHLQQQYQPTVKTK